MKKTALILLFLLIVPSLSMGETISLDEAIKRAIDKNPAILALKAQVDSGKSAMLAEKARRYGEIILNGSITHTSDEVLVRPMTHDIMSGGFANMPFDDLNTMWSIGYRLPVYTGGALKSAYRAAALGMNARESELARTISIISYQVAEAYMGILGANEQITAWKTYIKTLKSLEKHIKLNVRQGKSAPVDILKVEYEIKGACLTIENLKRQKTILYAGLYALTGEPENGKSYELELVPFESFNIKLNLPQIEKLEKAALKNRHDLKAMRHFAGVQDMKVKGAKAGRLPQITLDTRVSGARGLNLGYDDQYWSVSASFSIPIFDFGKRRHNIEKNLHDAAAAKQRAKELELMIKKEVRSAVSNVRLAQKEIETHKSALALAKEVSRIEQLKYDNGRGNIDDLLQAKARQKLSEARLVKSRYDLLVALKNLRKTIEGDIK